jgi:putative protease
MRKPELIAPAGDFVALQAALDGGCDAVYLGVDELNMRANARNFCLEDLAKVSDRAKQYSCKVRLTLNTIVFPAELARLREILLGARPYVDSVICWDFAVIELCNELSIPFHVSTQASVANEKAALFYKRLGARRIVLARECTLADVRSIREEAGIEVETFVHGAMCVSVSGRCFLSQFQTGKSANRGACIQQCRREYEVRDVENEASYRLGTDYVMSAKDICTISFMDRLVEAKIDAFKIEGRNRNPEYVATVTSCYREAIDAVFSGSFSEKLVAEWRERLRRVFNRGFSEGFFFNRPITSFTENSANQAETEKVYVGKITNFYKKAGVAEILVQDRPFCVGDLLCVQGETTGNLFLTVQEVRVNGEVVESAQKGVCTVALDSEQFVRVNDRVFRLRDRPGKVVD